ncbi:hypothetical protein [Halobacterium litoreum]|uniref:Uncharacterized protein n=1 Tax=Halobacterium litoreum TaxID=2039234 RepID=A0ABD5N8S9_9EURY|nr:hypothetical protein [Halobacterium litoreum]UHH14880.1 hypothetical protein LT972_14835 [Halobacterium litoreum]
MSVGYDEAVTLAHFGADDLPRGSATVMVVEDVESHTTYRAQFDHLGVLREVPHGDRFVARELGTRLDVTPLTEWSK